MTDSAVEDSIRNHVLRSILPARRKRGDHAEVFERGRVAFDQLAGGDLL